MEWILRRLRDWGILCRGLAQAKLNSTAKGSAMEPPVGVDAEYLALAFLELGGFLYRFEKRQQPWGMVSIKTMKVMQAVAASVPVTPIARDWPLGDDGGLAG